MSVAPTSAIISPDELEHRLQGVNPSLANIVRQIYQASGGRVGVTAHGGFRERGQQEKMYQDYLNGGNLAAKPGHSMHERGLAIDFSGDLAWVAQHASEYGIVNSVPSEAWHYTLGDGSGAGVEGGAPSLPYDVGQTENPEDALANRLNAVFSMLGGASPAGVEPAHSDEMAQPTEDPKAGVSSDSAVSAGAAIGAGGGKKALQQFALQQFQNFGWGEGELPALVELWNRESGWNPDADNPTSSASGIAQKMTSIHGPIEGTPQGQILWGLKYIMGRYGSPSKALDFHNHHNWY